MVKNYKRWLTPLMVVMAAIILIGGLHYALGTSVLGSSPYNTYTRQAMAWRSGQTYLNEDVPHLELAIYEGRYYVSFPPVPTLPLLLCTYIFGMDTPDHLLAAIYGVLSSLMLYGLFRKKGFDYVSAALYAFFICFGSCMLPLMLNGAVWYQAQMLAFLFMVAAVALCATDHMTTGLLCYALSVGCRPFNVVYGIALLLVFFFQKRKEKVPVKKMARTLAPGIVLGLCVAAAYGVYNYIRFGNPLEFGHNYLPEFSTQGGVQFSFSHVMDNFKTYVLGFPLTQSGGSWKIKEFGYSFLLACPSLTLMLILAGKDIIKRRFSRLQGVVLCCFLIHLFCLLLHRTFGGYQLGARYTVDLLPYSVMYLVLSGRKSMGIRQSIGLSLGFALCLFGVFQVHL